MSSPPVIGPTPEPTPAPRLTSLDAFRGFTMLLMASEIAGLPRALLHDYAGNGVAFFVADMLEHREWVGVTPWDLIQPSFMFMVGVALPFSVASRRERGHAFGRLFGHAVLRSLILILLGIFLRSQGSRQTYFTFEDVLTQIGLGYPFLFLLAWARPRWQAVAAVAILVGYWAAFALYPLPPPDFDWASVGVPAGWPHHLSGFAAHWDKNVNLAHAADVWFLNLFPRESPFRFNGGGYLTLNFVPSLATMIFGLLAGGLVKSAPRVPATAWRLAAWGAGGIVIGLLLHVAGVCPLVKRIWTPSWAIFSAGWAALFLAAWYAAIDLRGWTRVAFPFLVVGMNSIAMYVIVHVADRYTMDALRIHFGTAPFAWLGPTFVPVLLGVDALAIFWLILWWMYRRRLFLRI
jgi:heparan-alpha-glucosaminide N-acetyltransferase